MSIGLFTYLTALTPYVLRVNLGIPDSRHGQLSGDLQFWQEILVLCVVGWWGAASDRFGRRSVYIAAFIVMAAAYILYPLAGSTAELFSARLVFGLGIAGSSVLLGTILADYPLEASRGKLTGLAFFLNGLGSVIFFVGLTKLPQFFAARGANPVQAGRESFFVVAALAVLAALVMLGLKPGRIEHAATRKSLSTLVAEGLRAARNPRIALAYGSAFAARADMAIITIFVTLWVVQSAAGVGESAGQATAKAGMTVAVAQLASLLWAPVIGYLGDRMDRLTLLVFAFGVAAIGYGWVGLLTDIRASSAIPALIALGLGQASAILASTVLLAQEAPAAVRGSTFGMQTFCGGLGILAISAGGGRLFDSFGPGTPFLVVGVANAAVLAWGLALRISERRVAHAPCRSRA
jgi:MFS family permease